MHSLDAATRIGKARNGTVVNTTAEHRQKLKDENVMCTLMLSRMYTLATTGQGGVYREKGRPVYFVYDSYHVRAAEWTKDLLQPVRGTELDGIFVG